MPNAFHNFYLSATKKKNPSFLYIHLPLKHYGLCHPSFIRDNLGKQLEHVFHKEKDLVVTLQATHGALISHQLTSCLSLQQLVGHAGIGKRRLASYIRKEIVPPPTLTPSFTDPAANNGSNSTTSPSTTTSVAQPFNRSSSSSTKVSFRTAESIPDGIRHEDGQVSLLPIFKALPPTINISSSTVTGLNDQGAVDSVARYDLILLLITMANRDSWDDCKRAILRLDPGWFLGRVAIVVTEGWKKLPFCLRCKP